MSLPDGEHVVDGKKFTKDGNIFERDGQKLSARGIERSFKDVPKSDAADDGVGAGAGGRIIQLIDRFKEELKNAHLDEEQQGIYDVMTRQKSRTVIRVQDLDSLREYVLLKGSRGKGAHKILTVHYAGIRGKVTADEIINIGNAIRNGVFHPGDERHPTSHTYDMIAGDGARLRVVIDFDKKKKESVINFYSNRKAESRAHQASSGITDSDGTLSQDSENASSETGKIGKKSSGEVPSNYKTFNEKGDWELSKNLNELQNDFVSALNNGKHLRIETPKGNAHMMKAGEGFIFEGVNGKIYRWDDSAIRNMLARFITSPNPNVRIIEESAAQHFADRRILRDGSLLRAGDYAAFGKTKEHPSLYTGQVVSIGKKNVKLKTRSDMYGEQVLTLPWSDYKAHYPKSEVSLAGKELEAFQAEHGGATPEQFDQAKISFMEQRLNREGRGEREITSAAGERAEARTKREVENFVSDSGRRFRLKENSAETRPYYAIPFEDGLKRVVDPAQKGNRNPVYVRDTPKVFRDIGFASLPMMANARHLRLNYYTEGEFEANYGKMRTQEHAHGLHDAIKSLPNALEHPLAIVVNQAEHAKPGSVVAITDMDVKGKKIVVPVLIEATSSADNERIDSHLVLTVYDESDWMGKFLKPALEAEKNGVGIFYFDKEKASRYSALSKKEGSIPTGLVHNINDDGSPVKGLFKKNTETLQFKRWFGDSKVVDENGEPLVVYHDTNAKIYVNKETGENWDDLSWEARDEWGAGCPSHRTGISERRNAIDGKSDPLLSGAIQRKGRSS